MKPESITFFLEAVRRGEITSVSKGGSDALEGIVDALSAIESDEDLHGAFGIGRSAKTVSPREVEIWKAIRLDGEKQAAIAKEFHISQSTVSKIARKVDQYQRMKLRAWKRQMEMHSGFNSVDTEDIP